MVQDLSTIITWWGILFLIGIVCLPITTRVFSLFFDRGYAFSKILGVLLLSYFSWLLPSLHILKFNQQTILFIITFLALINGLLLIRNWRSGKIFSTESDRGDNRIGLHIAGGGGGKDPDSAQRIFASTGGKETPDRTRNPHSIALIILFEELLFLGGLLFWSLVRGQEPSIHGLEKFMDFGFMNSILRTDYFPPKDLWLTPLSINYYYFGHLWASVLFKLSSIAPEIGYNLVLASIFGISLSAVFSLGFNLFHLFTQDSLNKDTEESHSVKSKQNNIQRYSIAQKATHPSIIPSVITGIIATFLVNLAGNLHTIYAFTAGYPNEKPVPFWQLPFGWNPQTYWYPNATRFIPYTIHEFPIYSYVVADLHGHVLNIPFVLLTIAILTSIFLSKKIERLSLFLLPFLIAVLYMTNATDGLVYGGLSALVIAYKWVKSLKNNSLSIRNVRVLLKSYRLYLNFLVYFVWLAIGFILFSLPFSMNFKPFVKGIGVVPLNGHSPLYMLFILWGLPLFFTVCFKLFLFGKHLKQKSQLLIKGETLVQSLAKLTGTPVVIKSKSQRIPFNFDALYPSDLLVLLFLFVSFGLIIFPEFFYFHDIYPLHYRANTMFKLGYQAFIMFGICGAYILVRILQSKKSGSIFLIFASVFLILVSIYPYFAIKSFYGNLNNYKTLNGMEWLKAQYPSDYEAIEWIRKNIKGQPVILEGVGESYTDYARVSSFTGLPTVIGWPVHEWLWRGSYDEAGKRVAEMQSVYEAPDTEKSKNLLSKYRVRYIFIGQLEKQKYPKLDEEKFNIIGKVIFNNQTTKIYEIL